MKKNWKGFVFGLFTYSLIGGAAFTYGQSPSANPAVSEEAVRIRQQLADDAALRRKKIEENGDPVAEFNPPEISDVDEREMRRLRNSKFDDVSPDIRNRAVTLDKSKSIFNIGSWTSRVAKPAFPCRSNLIAVGTVSDAKGFVSNDKTRVYSEFDFQISNILKSDSNLTAGNESRIVLNRPGGKVRMPSGQILHILMDGLHMPEPGKQYLMFLEYDEKSRTYEIITGYQYKEGRIESLDGINLSEKVQGIYSNYPKYNGTEIDKFESLVLASFDEAKNCDRTKYVP